MTTKTTTKRIYDGKILRNLALHPGILSPMRALLIYMIAASHNRPFTYSATATILKRAGIGKAQYYPLMKRLEELGVIHRVTVGWGRTIGTIVFVNKRHGLLCRRRGKLAPQIFRIDRGDAGKAVRALLTYRRKSPKGGVSLDKRTERKIVARCLKALRKRGMVRGGRTR